MMYLSTYVMYLCQCAGESLHPCGRTLYSNVPQGVSNAVRYFDSSSSSRSQNASFMSIFEKYLYFEACCNASSRRAALCLWCIVMSLSGVRSMTKRSVPSFRGTNIGVQALRAEDLRRRPVKRFSLRNWNSFVRPWLFIFRCRWCQSGSSLTLMLIFVRFGGPFALTFGSSRSRISESEKLFVVSDDTGLEIGIVVVA